MTRMWLVDPRVMCRDHLLGEHSELHQLVGSIQNHPHGEAIAMGHADKHQIDTSLIAARHRELVAELERRGHSHDSPLEYQDELCLGVIDVDANRRDLNARCDDCFTENATAW